MGEAVSQLSHFSCRMRLRCADPPQRGRSSGLAEKSKAERSKSTVLGKEGSVFYAFSLNLLTKVGGAVEIL
jgi:hypothetical protein